MKINKNMVDSCRKNSKEKPMKMRMIGDRWYSNFRHKGEKQQYALDAWGGTPKDAPNEAYIELGTLMSDLKKGLNPGGVRKKVKDIKVKKPTSREADDLRLHIYPFFGEYKWVEVDKDLIEKYFEKRWGLNSKGGLQAPSTVDKELRALAKVMRIVDRKWEKPKIRYEKLERETLEPLTFDQIILALTKLPAQHHGAYWVMAYTAMDVSDVISLCPKNIKDGWIIKERGKSGQDIAVPICKSLKDIFSKIPYPLDKNKSIFPDINPKSTASAIRRSFSEVGLHGYGSKYLRRYVASMLLDDGYSHDWIGKALAHADGSKVTQKYTKVYKATLETAFAKLG
jgi:integrase